MGSGIEKPNSLMLVYLHHFDLLRKGEPSPLILIDGEPVDTGALPGTVMHRRHLIKATAPLTVATVCRERSESIHPVDPDHPGKVVLDDRGEVSGLAVRHGGAEAAMLLDPALPPLGSLPDGREVVGDWFVRVDGASITGGTWRGILMGLVTRTVPVFRKWPTSYRWTTEVALNGAARRPAGNGRGTATPRRTCGPPSRDRNAF